MTLQEARLLLKEDDELIQEVFEYWSRKRRSCKKPSLIPLVKQEKRDGSSTSDPYVAFRRRTEKMQTRKVITHTHTHTHTHHMHSFSISFAISCMKSYKTSLSKTSPQVRLCA